MLFDKSHKSWICNDDQRPCLINQQVILTKDYFSFDEVKLQDEEQRQKTKSAEFILLSFLVKNDI